MNFHYTNFGVKLQTNVQYYRKIEEALEIIIVFPSSYLHEMVFRSGVNERQIQKLSGCRALIAFSIE